MRGIITDHAILRYLERVERADLYALWREASADGYPASIPGLLSWMRLSGHFDIEGLRQTLLCRIKTALKFGATSVRLDGVTYVLAGATLVTVLSDGMRPFGLSRIHRIAALRRRRAHDQKRQANLLRQSIAAGLAESSI